MPGYVVVISPDPMGIPQGKTYKLDEDSQLLAVVALLQNPQPVQPQVCVIQDGLHVRGGPDEKYLIIRSLRVGDILPVFEQAKDLAGNDWVRISGNEWIARVYAGRIKAEWVTS